ncbi:MAG: 50S ribosomal protein L18 [Ruminococcus sp.]|jgi:large subunit ribosomal protein L18|nr:50S ribosomal protein L18 [Ruminococcus sp.]
MVKQINRKETRAKRQLRVRGKISGTADRPRLNVFRSAKHIYAQLIDDAAGVTIASASSMEKDFTDFGGNVAAAKKIGTVIAERAKAKGITAVVFDRAGYLYHGRVAAVAEGAREGGLEF